MRSQCYAGIFPSLEWEFPPPLAGEGRVGASKRGGGAMSTVVSDEKATAKTAPKEYRQFIGGEWVSASNGATYPDRNPFTSEPMATIPASTRDRDAARLWQYGRAETLRRVADHRRHPLRRDLRGGRLPARGRQRHHPRARPGRAGRR